MPKDKQNIVYTNNCARRFVYRLKEAYICVYQIQRNARKTQTPTNRNYAKA